MSADSEAYPPPNELAAFESLCLDLWGGVGKTSLVARWAAGLAKRDYDGADTFNWSFYSQSRHPGSGGRFGWRIRRQGP